MSRLMLLVAFVVAFVVAGLAGSASAHHSEAGLFDSSRTIEITGVVKSVSWRNPHGRIVLTVTDDKGAMTDWDAETASISVLRNRGADAEGLISAGDKITIAGAPPHRDVPQILATSVLLPSGYEFTFGSATPYFPAGKAGRIVGKASIDADVAKARAAANGLFRVWATNMGDPAAFPMFKGGYPLNAAGKAKLAEWNPRDNELLKCGHKGTPLIMISPLPMELSKQGDDILLAIEEYDARRVIHMSPNAVAPAEHTQFGFSRGHWDGMTLVVETDHIQAQYFDHEGTPQSDQIKVVERFKPSAAYDRIDYTLTTTDPVYFAKQFELARYWVWKPEMTVHSYECLDR